MKIGIWNEIKNVWGASRYVGWTRMWRYRWRRNAKGDVEVFRYYQE